MTPEEVNRTIEFILQHEARFEARLDREQEMRQARLAEHKKIIDELARLQARVVEMIAIESSRLDRSDEEHRRYEDWQREFQRQAERHHKEALARLDRILEKLTEKN